MSTTLGTWIKDRLSEAGSKGASISDLHRLRKDEVEPLVFKGGSLGSFYRYFSVLVRLKWVRATKRTAPAYIHGTRIPLKQPKKFFTLTDEGRQATDLDWSDPQRTLYPLLRPLTGRPIGRPKGLSS